MICCAHRIRPRDEEQTIVIQHRNRWLVDILAIYALKDGPETPVCATVVRTMEYTKQRPCWGATGVTCIKQCSGREHNWLRVCALVVAKRALKVRRCGEGYAAIVRVHATNPSVDAGCKLCKKTQQSRSVFEPHCVLVAKSRGFLRSDLCGQEADQQDRTICGQWQQCGGISAVSTLRIFGNRMTLCSNTFRLAGNARSLLTDEDEQTTSRWEHTAASH